jgi:trk system potassium uptake protein TrkA
VLRLAGKENINFNNIMILGGGKIGRRVASVLSEKMSVKLIESDEEKTFDLANKLPNALIIRGDGRDIDLLAKEGIIDVDAFVALTADAETNLITCLMAKHLGVKKAIALVDKVDYIPLTQTIGLDSLINKKLIAANSISRFIRKKDPIKNLGFPKGAIVGGIVRGNESYIATGNTEIKSNDRVVVFCLPDAVKKVEKFFK